MPDQSPTSVDGRRFQAELAFLSELAEIVSSTSNFTTVLNWIVQRTTALLDAEEGSIKLLDDHGTAPALHTMIRQRPSDSDPLDFAVAASVTGWILTKGTPLASSDLLSDPRFPGLRNAKSRVRSILAAPLRIGSRITGVLVVTHREASRTWSDSDTQLLSIIATHSASVLENARLREVEEEKRRMEVDLSIARSTQMGLVPASALHAGPWEVLGRVMPARAVGGDYYDYLLLTPERFMLAIADVSGKGMPAALLMSNLQATLRAHATGRESPREVMQRVNSQVARFTAPATFITMFYAEVDVSRQTLTYTNAGHNYPLLGRAGVLEELTAGGLVLGMLEDASYEEDTVSFTPAEALFLYSDGVSEASDATDAQFGEDRLRELWLTSRTLPAVRVLDRVFAEVEAFRGAAPQSDDITAVVVSAARD